MSNTTWLIDNNDLPRVEVNLPIQELVDIDTQIIAKEGNDRRNLINDYFQDIHHN